MSQAIGQREHIERSAVDSKLYIIKSVWFVLDDIPPLSRNVLDRIIYASFPPFCQVIQRCPQEWKGQWDLLNLYS